MLKKKCKIIYHVKNIIKYGVSNKHRRVGKPWWNIELQSLWNNICDSENAWRNCNTGAKNRLKYEFVHKRKPFDRKVQSSERSYWYTQQNELLINATNTHQQFWKSIGRAGVRDNRATDIPTEIDNELGEATQDKNEVFDKWKHDFCSLYNSSIDRNVNHNLVDVKLTVESDVDDNVFIHNFTLMEVKHAEMDIKQNRAICVDELPGEIFKNDTVIRFLHHLFNKCFCYGT